MMRRLPPIFAKHRFSIPKSHLPGVLFCVTPEMDHEAHTLLTELDWRDAPISHFVSWWLEYRDLSILARVVGETEYRLQWFGRKSAPARAFTFDTDLIDAEEWPLGNLEKAIAASYVRGAVLLNIYTEREAEVSVNTKTRNKPQAFIRQGDTLRYASLDNLASAAGQHRQRGYERPENPSGIHMREHDVRGHWRTYSSGVRVWVRPHKRGDASLGRVQRVIG